MTRSEAARINGAKSRGPKTPEGKQRSRSNAFKHGLHAGAVVLSSEDPKGYDELARSYFEHLQPAGPIETDLVHQLIVTAWRQRRLWAMETAAIDHQIFEDSEYIDGRYSELSDETRTELAIKSRVNYSGDLDWITRTESRVGRQYLRLLKTLQEVQQQRTRAQAVSAEAAGEKEQNEPEPPRAAASRARPAQKERNEPEPPRPPQPPGVLPIDIQPARQDSRGPTVRDTRPSN